MKYRSIVLMLCCVMMFGLLGGNIVFADAPELTTEPEPMENWEHIMQSCKICTISEEPQKAAITCFDVDEHGNFAIGSRVLDQKSVNVYSSEGAFLYGFTFDAYESFQVSLTDGEVTLYLRRSGLAVELDRACECVRILQIPSTTDNSIVMNRFVRSTVRHLGDVQYRVQNDMGFLNHFTSEYSQLVKLDAEGGRTLLYDVKSEQFPRVVFFFTAGTAFIFFVVFALVRLFVKTKRQHS